MAISGKNHLSEDEFRKISQYVFDQSYSVDNFISRLNNIKGIIAYQFLDEVNISYLYNTLIQSMVVSAKKLNEVLISSDRFKRHQLNLVRKEKLNRINENL